MSPDFAKLFQALGMFRWKLEDDAMIEELRAIIELSERLEIAVLCDPQRQANMSGAKILEREKKYFVQMVERSRDSYVQYEVNKIIRNHPSEEEIREKLRKVHKKEIQQVKRENDEENRIRNQRYGALLLEKGRIDNENKKMMNRILELEKMETKFEEIKEILKLKEEELKNFRKKLKKQEKKWSKKVENSEKEKIEIRKSLKIAERESVRLKKFEIVNLELKHDKSEMEEKIKALEMEKIQVEEKMDIIKKKFKVMAKQKNQLSQHLEEKMELVETRIYSKIKKEMIELENYRKFYADIENVRQNFLSRQNFKDT